MRRDIELHIKTNDITLVATNKTRVRTFRWVNNPSGLSRYIYGEIDVPAVVSETKIRENGVFVNIPYTPKYKEFMVRVRRVFDDGSYIYLYNRKDGSEWFLAQAGMYGGEKKNCYASLLYTISEGTYYLSLKDEVATIYSSIQSDFNIVDANRQNANCLLACFPSNSYRYPLTGVGLARWINAHNINAGNLAEIINREFAEDSVVVKNATYNYDTQQMEMDLDASSR